MSVIYIDSYRFASAAAPLLLDTYSGAAAAYSLRKLRTGVTNVVRVRRSSDNTEQDFTATQVTDGTLTTFCGAGDGFVRTWYDQSGSGNHAQQTTNTSQPKIVDQGGLILVNSRPSVLFDGSNDSLAFSTITTSVYSTHAVIRKGSTSSNFPTVGIATGNGQSVGVWSDGKLYENNGTAYVYTSYTNNTNQNLFSVIKNGNNLSDFAGWQNGTQLGSYSGTPFGSIAFSGLGVRTADNRHALGELQEIVFYLVDQTTNRAAIEANINAHYTIF